MNQNLEISQQVLKIHPFKNYKNDCLITKAFKELSETEDVEDFIYNLNNIVTRELTSGEYSHG